MNNSPYTVDFEAEARKARKLSKAQLHHAIADAQQCVALCINPDKYRDQIAVYRAEIARRK